MSAYKKGILTPTEYAAYRKKEMKSKQGQMWLGYSLYGEPVRGGGTQEIKHNLDSLQDVLGILLACGTFAPGDYSAHKNKEGQAIVSLPAFEDEVKAYLAEPRKYRLQFPMRQGSSRVKMFYVEKTTDGHYEYPLSRREINFLVKGLTQR